MTEAPLPVPEPSNASRASFRPGRWHLTIRICFRFGFIYLLLYSLLGGNASILGYFPFIGRPLQNWISGPSYAIAQSVGQHWFHLTGLAAKWHGGGSADIALEYIRILCFAIIAALGTAIWSALDRHRPNYETLLAWLLYALRLTLGFTMLAYGLLKVFPLQMSYPGNAVLSDTYGASSPFILLWTLIGLHPAYECLCGMVEVMAGLLLFFQRTTAVGALVALVAVSNIVLYNYFFDVPLKIISAHMELFCFILMIPNLAPLWNLFFLGQTARLPEITILPLNRPWLRITLILSQCVVLVSASSALLVGRASAWQDHLKSMAVVPIMGIWHVDAIKTSSTEDAPASPDGSLWSTLYIEHQNFGYYRSADGVLWPAAMHYDPVQHLVRIVDFAGTGTGMGLFDITLEGNDRLTLSRQKNGASGATILLHRVPPTPYRLTSRGFHWINETLFIH